VGAYGGGAIHNYLGGTLALTNVTLSGNRGEAAGGGLVSLGTATLRNVTIVGNSSDLGGNGIATDSGMALTNVALSNPGPDCLFENPIDTSNRNLSSDASCSFGPGRDNVALKLGPLDTNGGPTQTHRLLPGSPAINDGTSVGCPGTDQRGVSRPRGPACEVGAFEFVPCAGMPPAPTLLSPAGGARLASNRPTLDWVGPDCAHTFNVLVRRGSTGGPTAFSANGLTASRTTTSALARNRTYWWRAAACTPAGCTPSAWSKLTILP
jgi:hypothetical protein